jgi:hypothetical protein
LYHDVEKFEIGDNETLATKQGGTVLEWLRNRQHLNDSSTWIQLVISHRILSVPVVDHKGNFVRQKKKKRIDFEFGYHLSSLTKHHKV